MPRPLPPGGRRTYGVRGANDVRAVQRASSAIAELGAELDRQLATERRPEERMRMLREATNRITRTANDAIHAYARASGAVNAELARPDANVPAASERRRLLDDARRELLDVLELAGRRYPWTDARATSPAEEATANVGV